MRIACLITVCVALISTISGTENARQRRRSEAVVYRVQPRNGPVSTEKKPQPGVPGPRISRSLDPGPQKMSRRSWQPYGPGPRRGLRRSFRARRQLRPKTIQLGRSYDVTENHLETIQTPEMFEAGTIHIEPVYRVSKKKSILDELVDLVHRTINPRKSHLGPLVGPFNFPGVGDKIYIRLLEPLNTNRLVVKLVSHLPVADIEPFDQNNLFSSFGQTAESTHELTGSGHYVLPDSSSSPSNQRRNVHQGLTGLHASASNHLVKVAKPLGGKPGPIMKDVHGAWTYGSNFKHTDARYRFDQSKTAVKNFARVQSPQRIVKYEQGKILKQLPLNGTDFHEVPMDSYPYYTPQQQDFTSGSNTLKYEDSVAKESLNPVNLATVEDPPGSKVTRNSRVTGPDQEQNEGTEAQAAFQVVEAPALAGQVRPMVSFVNYIYSNDTAWRSNSTDGFRPIDPYRSFKPSASVPVHNSFAPTTKNENRLENRPENRLQNRPEKTRDNGWEPIKSETESSIRVNRRIVESKSGKASQKVSESLNIVDKQRKPSKQIGGQSGGSKGKKIEQKQKKSFEYEEYEYVGEPIFVEYYDEHNASDSIVKTTTTTRAPSVGRQTGKRNFDAATAKKVERAKKMELSFNTTKSSVDSKPMAKPVSSAVKPIGLIEKPIDVIEKPIGLIEKPIDPIVKPIGLIEKPISSVEKVISNAERPTSSTVTPISSTMKPVSTTSKPSVSSGTTRKPLVSTTRRPPVSSTTRKPAVSTAKISTTTKGFERPVVSSAAKKLTLTSSTVEKPSSTTRKPGFLPKKFSISSTTRRPVSTTKATTTSASVASTTKRFSVSTTRKPTTTVHTTRRPFFNSTRALALKSKYFSGQHTIQVQNKLAKTNSTKDA